ncbi:hypothetical protein [Streptomyces sp. TRM70350]|uniref:hypothetical protein n=1 Tax=Streptomyces sp. TRM70350 TaxID=2856165 RepID=UPI001C46FDE1|nr:hypothetical protein [Streptomyces sp. TRM70350]MBV7698493.1 hypothetical protein [Streptomyces sp. TRM70350]
MRTAYRLVLHELRLSACLVLWVARRTRGTRQGRAFGYARGQSAILFGFTFVCVVETVVMSVLLYRWPTVHHVVLFLDVYTVFFVIGLHAASVVRPHVLEPGALRIRKAAHLDLRIPLERIAAVRRELRMSHEKADGVLDVEVGGQTTVTLELAEPVTHVTLLGRRRDVSLVRVYADEADALVQAVTRARSAPSPLPDLPA